MNRRGRILITDDYANWREEVTEILQREGYHADSAATYDEAQARVSDVNYHVLIVDIRMKETDQTNEDGIKLLEDLQKRGSNEATQVIMLSAHGTRERIRTAFREYQVADFLYKEEFDKQMFLKSVREVFVEKVKINLALDIGWQEGSSPERAVNNLEVEGTCVMHGTILHSQITAELEDLLCRLFHTAKSIMVRPLRSGKSGTGILRVQPFYATGGGGYEVVVKFGDPRLIEQEHDNFKQFVQPFLGGGHNTAIQEFRRTPRLGGIIYSMLGTTHDQLTDFGEFYSRSVSHQICTVLDRLLHDTCGAWYANRGDLKLLDLTADYQRLMSGNLNALEQMRYSQLTTVAGNHKLFFTSLINHRDHPFTNPIQALMGKTLKRPTYASITHGDLHQRNMFVDTTGSTWLIDFQETAQSHILRDVAILDSVIRFQLLPSGEATLEERLQMEKALCSIERFSQVDDLLTAFTTSNQALAKAYKNVVHLRLHARKLVELNPDDDMSEYYIALLYIAVNTIGFSTLAIIQREHALLSASLLADRLNLEGESSGS